MKKHSRLILVSLLLVGILLGCTPQAYDVPEQSPVTNSPIATAIPLATETATATLSPTVVPSATPEPQPTATATPLPPTPTMRPTPTTIPAAQMRGEWRRITTADGLCTDSPRFIGVWYIGTETTKVCRFDYSGDEITWFTHTVPLGKTVYAVEKFPPGGGERYATDAGICYFDGIDWLCRKVTEGYPYNNIHRIGSIETEAVLMLADSVVYGEQIYPLSDIVGSADASATWLATSAWNKRSVSGKVEFNPEIWVGTDTSGIVVILPETVRHYTVADGLPSNEIRAIDIGEQVWVATSKGVGRWDGEHWTVYTTLDGLPSNDVKGIVERKNTVWIATADGAAYFDGQIWRAFKAEDGLPESDLNGVMLLRDDAVWFSTYENGLVLFTIQAASQ